MHLRPACRLPSASTGRPAPRIPTRKETVNSHTRPVACITDMKPVALNKHISTHISVPQCARWPESALQDECWGCPGHSGAEISLSKTAS